MRSPHGWTFGNIEIVLPGVSLPAGELLECERMESEHELSRLLQQWLRDPLTRTALLHLARQVVPQLFQTALGRSTGRDYDHHIVAALLRVFAANKLHALRRPSAASSSVGEGGRGARARWRIGPFQIVRNDFSLPVDELARQVQIEDPRQFAKLLDTWLQQAGERQILADVYMATVDYASGSESPEALASALQMAWEQRRFFLLRPKNNSGGAGEGDVPGAPAQASGAGKGSTKTWIEVVLIDDNDQPVPGAKYRLKITDGSIREGVLDSAGRVRVNGIDPGTCEVSFPEIDAKEWNAA